MKIVRFVAHADPLPEPRLGTVVDGVIVDLQAAHFAMTGAPNPGLRAPEDLQGRRDAGELVRKVAAWASTQDVPGTRVPQDAVRMLGSFDV